MLESMPKTVQNGSTCLFDVLSYLLDQSERLGFSFETKIEQGKMIFEIESNDKENKIMPVLLELLFAHIFENLGKFGSEIPHTDTETIVKIALIKFAVYLLILSFQFPLLRIQVFSHSLRQHPQGF